LANLSNLKTYTEYKLKYSIIVNIGGVNYDAINILGKYKDDSKPSSESLYWTMVNNV